MLRISGNGWVVAASALCILAAGCQTHESGPSDLATEARGARASRVPEDVLRSHGLENILFEVDYPHSNGSWPNSRAIAAELFAKAGMNAHECYRLVRGNAIDCYGLQRFGITN